MRTLLAVLSLGFLIGCAGKAPAVSSAQRWMDRNGGPCVSADAGRLERLAGRFAGVVQKPIRVHTLDRSDLRAFGFPSGDIVLTAGLVSALTDNELTAVIGHEVGHLLNDGHGAVALTGRPRGVDSETAADATSVKLLSALQVPAESMRLALTKVHAALPANDPAQSAIAARIALLP